MMINNLIHYVLKSIVFQHCLYTSGILERIAYGFMTLLYYNLQVQMCAFNAKVLQTPFATQVQVSTKVMLIFCQAWAKKEKQF